MRGTLLRVEDLVHADGEIREEAGGRPLAAMEDARISRIELAIVLCISLGHVHNEHAFCSGLLHEIDGTFLRTIELPSGLTILWEHLGMLDKQSYRDSWAWKLDWYRQNGFKLGENLFTTEDNAAGGLDQAGITKVAQEIDSLL